jgi:putative pyruvate formate lyase activating enzyme
MSRCNICPRRCYADRAVKVGDCGCGEKLKINLAQLHYGEEPIISGEKGSGTIFFSGCNLHCEFCQNFTISQERHGSQYTVEELSQMMLELEGKNAHNINLVTPTHFSMEIKKAIMLAKEKGLKIPIVWNSNGYEEVDTLKQMEGLVDIYLPDLKYSDSDSSFKYSGAKNYPEKARLAIKEMFRQAGNIKLRDSMAYKGVMIRLLVLPHDINSIEETLKWINDEMGNEVFISLMGQYYPTYNAGRYKELSRGITKKEYQFALDIMEKYGFENGFVQDVGSDSDWTPEFIG